MKHPAFTIIEMVIVTMVMALLTVTVAISFTNARVKAKFNAQESRITNLVQQARGLALTNLLIDEDSTEATAHYRIDVTTEGLTLTAVGEEGTEKEIDAIELEEGFEIRTLGDELEAYYFPPYGDICFNEDCDSGEVSRSFTLFTPDEDTDYETQYSLSIYSGFLQTESD